MASEVVWTLHSMSPVVSCGRIATASSAFPAVNGASYDTPISTYADYCACAFPDIAEDNPIAPDAAILSTWTLPPRHCADVVYCGGYLHVGYPLELINAQTRCAEGTSTGGTSRAANGSAKTGAGARSVQSAKNLRSLVGPVVGWPVPEPWLVPHGLPLSAYRMVVLMPLVLTVIQDDLLVAAFVRDHFPGLVRVASPSMEPQASLMAPPFQPHAQPQPQPEPPPHASPCLPALHPDWPCTSGSLMHSISSALTLPSAQRWMSRSYNSLQFLGSCVLNLVVCRALYFQHPEWDESQLGDTKDLVKGHGTLSQCAKALSLDRYLIRQPLQKWNAKQWDLSEPRPGEASSPKVLEKVVHALIGAVYLHGGLGTAGPFMEHLLNPVLATCPWWQPQQDSQTYGPLNTACVRRVVLELGQAGVAMVEQQLHADGCAHAETLAQVSGEGEAPTTEGQGAGQAAAEAEAPVQEDQEPDPELHPAEAPAAAPAHDQALLPGAGGTVAERLCKMERVLGYQFRDKALGQAALTHRSAEADDVQHHFQNLEFLGDAVLDVVLATYFYRELLGPGASLQMINKLRTQLANRQCFGMVALLLSLPQLLVHDIFNITDRLAKFPLEKAFRRARLAPRDRATLSSDAEPSTPPTANTSTFLPWIPEPTHECALRFMRKQAMPESTVSCAVPKFACDVLEAVVGAVFLDNGLDAVRLWDDILRPIFAPLASAMLQQPVAGPTSDSKVPTLDSSAKSTGDSKAMSTSNSKAPMTAPVLVDLRPPRLEWDEVVRKRNCKMVRSDCEDRTKHAKRMEKRSKSSSKPLITIIIRVHTKVIAKGQGDTIDTAKDLAARAAMKWAQKEPHEWEALCDCHGKK